MPVVVHVLDHPLAAAALTKVRDEATPNNVFRQELERIGTLLLVEATRALATNEVQVQTPLTTTTGRVLSLSLIHI